MQNGKETEETRISNRLRFFMVAQGVDGVKI